MEKKGDRSSSFSDSHLSLVTEGDAGPQHDPQNLPRTGGIEEETERKRRRGIPGRSAKDKG